MNVAYLCTINSDENEASIMQKEKKLNECLKELSEFMLREMVELQLYKNESRSGAPAAVNEIEKRELLQILRLDKWGSAPLEDYVVPLTILRSKVISKLPGKIEVSTGESLPSKKTPGFGSVNEVSCLTLGKQCLQQLVMSVIKDMKNYKNQWNILYFGKISRYIWRYCR